MFGGGNVVSQNDSARVSASRGTFASVCSFSACSRLLLIAATSRGGVSLGATFTDPKCGKSKGM